MSGDRIIVASEIAEEFAERLAQKAEGLPTGDPEPRWVKQWDRSQRQFPI